MKTTTRPVPAKNRGKRKKGPAVAKALDDWSKWMTRVGRVSERTIANHSSYATKWMADMGVADLPIGKVEERHINDYINDTTKAWKAGYRKTILSAIRSLFYYAVYNGWCDHDPSMLADVNLNVLSHKQKEVKQSGLFGDKEVGKLLAETDGFWRYAIGFSRFAGLRLSDIATLEWDCLSDPNHVVVWTRKGQRRVKVPLTGANAATGAGRLKSMIKKIPSTNSTYVFPDQRITQLDPKRRSLLPTQFSRILSRNIIFGCSFHGLRHTYATEMYNKGIDMPHIASFMGHANAKTTSGTYIHI